MSLFDFSMMDNAIRLIREGGKNLISDKDFIERELARFIYSPRRDMMLTGERYYQGMQDILTKRRTAIGEGGELTEVKNLPNSKILDNQYRKMVVQKTNYLVGQPITFRTDNSRYAELLKDVFNTQFMKTMKKVAKISLNEGICWLHPTYGEHGEFVFRVFPGHEVAAGWHDSDETVLDYAIRTYDVLYYEGTVSEKIVHKIEVYSDSGIDYFETDGGAYTITPCDPWHMDYFTIEDADIASGYNWSRIPLVPFRYNEDALPLIQQAKSLQDAMNTILSNFGDNMLEDSRNTVYVIVNYDGEDLDEFRHNLATLGAVKVSTQEGVTGDVRTLQVAVNSDNYRSILDLLKKAIIENCMGYDAKDDRLSGNPNQMNIQSMYNDIDLDANNMETEYQAAFRQLMWFVNQHLANSGLGDYDGVPVDVIFNRDMMMNEGDIIANIRNSSDLLSRETLISQHPWVDDVQAELERIKAEKLENMETFGNALVEVQDVDSDKEDKTDDADESEDVTADEERS